MNDLLRDHRPINLYTGVPQPNDLQIYHTPALSSAVITYVMLNNPSDLQATLTMSIGTQIVAVFKLDPNEIKTVNLFLVLKGGDIVALKQSDGGKISVSLNGSIA